MKQLATIVFAAFFALSSASVLAAAHAKGEPGMKKDEAKKDAKKDEKKDAKKDEKKADKK
jgi:hypothetical protein